MKELCRLLSKQLKVDGHTKYSETIKKSYLKLEENYQVNYSDNSLDALKEIKDEFSPIFVNVEKIVCNREVKDYTSRITTELERLISILTNSNIEIIKKND